MEILDRFLKYVRFDTQSDEQSGVCPSTAKQMVFAEYLKKELEEIGLEEITLDEHGYLFATLPANTDADVPVVGFIAHMDTSPDYSGKDVNPRIVSAYDGGDIVLSEELGIVTSPKKFPELLSHVGEDLVVTDGTTLLGADDKAGIAEIVSAMVYLKQHPEIKHGKIRVGFNPDEEIGMGAHLFDVEKFGCDWAYTMDGGEVGELEFENFNAASAHVTVKGLNVHPGYAKNKMINSNYIAAEFVRSMPLLETPEQTDGYEGFFHLQEMHGKAEKATMEYIVRDHDMKRFQERKAMMDKAAEQINRRWGDGTAVVDTHDQYYNMYEVLKDHMEILELAESAMKAAGIEHPTHSPIRGGTDGSVLTYKGLLCPNLPSAGHNAHGRYEYAPVESLKTGVKTVKALVSPELVETIIGKKEG